MTATTTTAPQNSLERRIELTVTMAEVEQEAQKRLAKISKTVKMSGFRPGKVPMKVVAQNYGGQARSEAIGFVVGNVYSKAVNEQKLKVAGQPEIEPVKMEGEGEPSELKFTAIVEVYPEVQCPDLTAVEISKTTCEITEADLDKTLETLQKQRTEFSSVDRASQKGDRVALDFKGEIDGVPFTGGASENYMFVLGDGSMLKEFDEAAVGMKAGETKTFPLKFPDDYHGKDVAGKLAMFSIKIRDVAEPKVPELNEEFVKSMGIESGDIAQLRADVKKNLAREVANRCKARTKSSVMDALAKFGTFEVPKALIESECERMAENTRRDLAARGMNVKDAPIPPELFKDKAVDRVRLGLIVGEVVVANNLRPTEEQIRTLVQEMASAYENPEQFVNWFMGQPQQRAQAEAVAIEDNVVAWALSKAKVSENSISVQTLLEQTEQA
jgi:trigger factor